MDIALTKLPTNSPPLFLNVTCFYLDCVIFKDILGGYLLEYLLPCIYRCKQLY